MVRPGAQYIAHTLSAETKFDPESVRHTYFPESHKYYRPDAIELQEEHILWQLLMVIKFE